MNKRPLPVTIIALLLIVTGVVGFAYHLADLRDSATPLLGSIGIEFVRVLAIVAGVFLLRGADWARWLAIAWMAFHVVISYWNGWGQVAFHAVMLALFTYFLTRAGANRYFAKVGASGI